MRRPVSRLGGTVLVAALLLPVGACGSGGDDCPQAREHRVRGSEEARLAAAEELSAALVDSVAVGLYNNLSEKRRTELGVPDPQGLLSEGLLKAPDKGDQDELTAWVDDHNPLKAMAEEALGDGGWELELRLSGLVCP